MADLKTGTTVGGAGLWHASNLPLIPSGNLITYRGWRIYTEQDKPTAADVGALSLALGGTVVGPVTLNKTLNVLGILTAKENNSTYRSAVIRSDGAAYSSLIRDDVKDLATGGPSTETEIAGLAFRNGSNTTDPYGGKVLGQLTTNWGTGGGGKVLLDARSGGTVKSRLTLDATASLATIDTGAFQVNGTTKLLDELTGTTATFSGVVRTSGVYPNNYGNFDVRYVTAPPKLLPSAFTNMQDASITQTNDIWTIGSAMTDGPLSTSPTTVSGVLVNYRCANNSGLALVQTLFIDGTQYVRTASGSPDAWTWFGTGLNGWRTVYDTNNKPAPGDFNAVAKTGDSMTGSLSVDGTITASNAINARVQVYARLITDPASPATGTRINTPEFKSGFNSRGNAAYFSMYGQELVGSYWQGCLSVIGFDKNPTWNFRQDGMFVTPGSISVGGQGNSFGGSSITLGDNDSGIRGGQDWVDIWVANARAISVVPGQVYIDKPVRVGSGTFYVGGGSAQLASDGNVFGTRWNGNGEWLYDWIVRNAMSDAGRGGQQYSGGSGNGNGRAYECPAGCFLTGINTNVSDGRGMGVYFRQFTGRKINGGQFGIGDFA